MPRTGFIDHIGVGVPDLQAAQGYYDELMPILGLRPWFPPTEAGELDYGPDGALGPQIFFTERSSRASTPVTAPGCSTCRSWSRAAPSCARPTSGPSGGAPRSSMSHATSPSTGPTTPTFFLDLHGFMLEVVCHDAED